VGAVIIIRAQQPNGGTVGVDPDDIGYSLQQDGGDGRPRPPVPYGMPTGWGGKPSHKE